MNRHPITKQFLPKDGLRRTPTGNSWSAMMSRCYNTNYNGYAGYGGKGRFVCEGLRRGVFAIIELIGERPNGRTIDRTDNDGNYTCGQCVECRSLRLPINIRWATQGEQDRNRINNVWLTIKSVTKCAADWKSDAGVTASTIYRRSKRGITGVGLLAGYTAERSISIGGATRSLWQWANEVGIGSRAMAWRIAHWPQDKWLLSKQRPRQVFSRLPC